MNKNASEEKIRILKMVEERKINKTKAMEKLNALEMNQEENIPEKGAKWLKVKVKTMDDKPKVNVKIPLSLANIGLKIAKTFNPKLKGSGLEQINIEEIINHVKDGAEGKIVDVEDEENQTKVKVYVE